MAMVPPTLAPQSLEATPLGLLSILPQEILELLVTLVPGKNHLRATCSGLRLAVTACTSELRWHGCDDEPLDQQPVSLAQLSLPAVAPSLLLLDCSGELQRRLSVHSLQGCPHGLHTLVCRNSLVEGLGPLAACRGLQVLDVSFTEVGDLGPLAACTALRTLCCRNTCVVDLGPLAGCTRLQAGLDIIELNIMGAEQWIIIIIIIC